MKPFKVKQNDRTGDWLVIADGRVRDVFATEKAARQQADRLNRKAEALKKKG